MKQKTTFSNPLCLAKIWKTRISFDKGFSVSFPNLNKKAITLDGLRLNDKDIIESYM